MSISALIIDDEQLAREELKYLLDSVGGVDVVAQGANGIEAVDLIEEHHPDLVFLDVQMPGQDGFAVIQRLMERSRKDAAEAEKRGGESAASAVKPTAALPHFVFATAYDQYAVRAFDVNAVDYLLKPFDRARVLEAVERVRVRLATGGSSSAGAPDAESQAETQIERLLRLLDRQEGRPQGAEPGRAPAKLIVQAQSRLLLVDQAEICFAAIDEGVIRVVTRAFEGQSKCRTLEELMELLDPARFWRAHRGFVVNIDQIREVMPWFKSSYQLRMNDKQQTEIPVSRAQTKRLRELFNL
ncbi:MAG: LytTR family DNA-binding domain-containing protein [Terracidiphilus sp.]|jgi:two-component system LytT family response regulator/two-component system response regulator LytT